MIQNEILLKVASLIISNDNCSPFNIKLTGTHSSFFKVIDKDLYLIKKPTVGTYNVTVSVVDVANRFTPISRNYSLTVTQCVIPTTTLPPTTTTTTTATTQPPLTTTTSTTTSTSTTTTTTAEPCPFYECSGNPEDPTQICSVGFIFNCQTCECEEYGFFYCFSGLECPIPQCYFYEYGMQPASACDIAGPYESLELCEEYCNDVTTLPPIVVPTTTSTTGTTTSTTGTTTSTTGTTTSTTGTTTSTTGTTTSTTGTTTSTTGTTTTITTTTQTTMEPTTLAPSPTPTPEPTTTQTTTLPTPPPPSCPEGYSDNGSGGCCSDTIPGDCECPLGSSQCGPSTGLSIICCPDIGWTCTASSFCYPSFGQFGSYNKPTTYEDIINNMIESKIKFVVIGGFAKYLHGLSPSYNDIDIIYENSLENISKLIDVICKVTDDNTTKYEKMYTEEKIRTNIIINMANSFDFINKMRGIAYEDLIGGALKFSVYNNLIVNVASTEDLNKLKLLQDQNVID